MPHQVYIGIGSNLGNKRENYLEALERIAKIPKTRIKIGRASCRERV